MGLEVFYPRDVEHALNAADHSMSVACENGDIPSQFAAGWRAALDQLSLAFGLPADYSRRHLALSLRYLQEIDQPVTLEAENHRHDGM